MRQSVCRLTVIFICVCLCVLLLKYQYCLSTRTQCSLNAPRGVNSPKGLHTKDTKLHLTTTLQNYSKAFPAKTTQMLRNNTRDQAIFKQLHDAASQLALKIVLVAPHGRLGNQMFEIAATYGIAKRSGRHMATIGHFDAGDVFQQLKLDELNLSSYAKLRGIFTLNETQAFNTLLFNLSTVAHLPVVRIGTYLQSWRYFADVGDDVKRMFTFTSEVASEAQSFFRLLASQQNIYYESNETRSRNDDRPNTHITTSNIFTQKKTNAIYRATEVNNSNEIFINFTCCGKSLQNDSIATAAAAATITITTTTPADTTITSIYYWCYCCYYYNYSC
jgi:hypothetical protein